MTRGSANSEAALYAAESGAEETAYKVLKNHCELGDPNSCGSNDTLSNGAEYLVEGNNDITVENADASFGNITLTPGKSFVLYLDIRGVGYPSAGLTVSCLTAGCSSDMVVLEEVIATGIQTETIYTDFSSSFVVPISVGASPYYLNSYYKITLHNSGVISQDYTINWTGNLPKSLKISKSVGTYKTFQRVIEMIFPRWQIIGGS